MNMWSNGPGERRKELLYYFQTKQNKALCNRTVPAIHASAPCFPDAYSLLASDFRDWDQSCVTSRVSCLCQAASTYWLLPGCRVLSEIYFFEETWLLRHFLSFFWAIQREKFNLTIIGEYLQESISFKSVILVMRSKHLLSKFSKIWESHIKIYSLSKNQNCQLLSIHVAQ